MYALNLDSDKRILSAWTVLSIGNYDGMPKVETLPDGDISDYLYVDGVYVYEPLPESEPKEPVDRLGQLEADVMYISMMTGVDFPTSEV